MTPDESKSSHRPVLAAEVVALMVTDRRGAYMDLTTGAGGHLKALAAKLDDAARLYGLDKDGRAAARAGRNLRHCRQVKRIVHAAYGDLKAVVGSLEDRRFDGILLDLGLSSDQLDDAERGFSFSQDGPLDMRFDPQSGGPTAAELLNLLERKALAAVFHDFGEEKQAARLAGAIVRERQNRMFATTQDLTALISRMVPANRRTKTLARCFQALRIAVNDELDELGRTLPIALEHLKEGGRLVVIAYHSLEDRIVKRFFRQEAKGCVCPPNLPMCVCGGKPRLEILTRRPVKPSAAEVAGNPRSRSARMRAAERSAP